jgi:hypothetical protein
MKKILTLLTVATMLIGTSVSAGGYGTGKTTGWGGRVAECFNEVHVPAVFTSTKSLVRAASEKYVHGKHGQIQLVKYAAIYRESTKLKTPEHYVLKKVYCKNY